MTNDNAYRCLYCRKIIAPNETHFVHSFVVDTPIQMRPGMIISSCPGVVLTAPAQNVEQP